MQKIVLINHLKEPGNKITGITNYLFYLLDELLLGDDFSYVLLTCWDENNLPDMLRGRNLKIITRPFIESTPKNILNQLFTVPRLARELGCVLEFNPNPVGCFIGSVPLVSTTHDLYFNVSPGSYKKRHRTWWNIFFPLTLRRSSKNISVSENTQRDLLNFYPWATGKTCVVKEAACLEGYVQPVERGHFGLFVANITPNKGADVLLKALAVLETRGCPCRVFHIGRDSDRYIERYTGELALTSPPEKLGYVADAQLCVQYSQARFLVFPSLYEGFGLPVLEAQKYGLPVIASDIRVLKEVAGEGALYFHVNDVEDLADKIQLLMSDNNLWSELSAKAIMNERKFSWQKAAYETEQVFQGVLTRQAEC